MNIIIDKRPLFLLLILKYYKFVATLFLALVFYTLLDFTPENISVAGYRTILIFIFAAVLWATNLIPSAITGLLILVLIPALSIYPIKQTFSLFGNEPLFFILSAFIISIATEKSGLSRRVTLHLLKYGTGEKEKLTSIVYILGASLSFFMPEHAVSVLILPIILSIANTLKLAKGSSNYGKLLFLSLAYGTIIGGIATFLGGARNALAVGLLQEIAGKRISFLEWIRFSLPLVIILLGTGYLILRHLFKPEEIDLTDVKENIVKELKRLAPFTFKEVVTLFIILFAVSGWMLIGHSGIGLGGIALISAILFFVLGVISWEEAERGINWSAIFMYGGALTLGTVFSKTDAIEFIMQKINFSNVGFVTYIFVIGIISLILTEFVSNAAVVALILPVALKIGASLGYDLKIITVSNALMSGLAFALPIGTPSHFVCYSTNYYGIKDSLKAGLLLNFVALLGLYICIKFFW